MEVVVRPGLRRVPFLLPAGLALVIGLDAGLMLLGVPAVPVGGHLPDVHGMLMVLGFVGTLVALERAVALRRSVGFLAPASLGLGGLLLLPAATFRVGQLLLVAGTTAFGLVYVALWRRSRDEAVVVQALGAVLALGAAIAWLRDIPVPRLLPLLAGFVILTIAGERLELARIELARSGPVLIGATAIVLTSTAALLWPTAGQALLGVSVLALVGWLASHDVARRTIRDTGLPRFAAACLLAAYAWLVVASIIWITASPVLEGSAYDAVVHSVFLGFTMSMIMAHAPVILPAVLRMPLPYRPALWGPAILLHVSLLLRIAVGDGRGWDLARQIGGTFNVVALLALVGVLVWSALGAKGRER